MIVEELTTVLGLDIDSKDLGKFQGSLAATVTKLGALVGVTFGAASALSALLDVAGQTNEATKFAEAIDVSFDSLQRLEFAAQQNGVAVGTLRGTLSGLRSAAQGAFSGFNVGAAESFALLGVNIRDANGDLKTSDQLLLDIADAIQNSTDPQFAYTVAEQLGLGPDLNLLLRLGSDGIRRLGNEAALTGAIMSDESAAASEEFRESVDALAASVRTLAFEAGLPLVEWLTTITQLTTGFVKSGDGKALADAMSQIVTEAFALGAAPVELILKFSDSLETLGAPKNTQGLILLGGALARFVLKLSPATKALLLFLAVAEDVNAYLEGNDDTFTGDIAAVPGRVRDNGGGVASLFSVAASLFTPGGLEFGAPTPPPIYPALDPRATRASEGASITIANDITISGASDPSEIVRQIERFNADTLREAFDDVETRYRR